ncbi:kinase [Apiospora rasikravindrae]|uniref:Kinase n=1 Tax=Apiospora rasikravindrae TaxID=990691 RepID=A0ABR1RVP4_9PEZI
MSSQSEQPNKSNSFDSPEPRTLFHLVPTNEPGYDALFRNYRLLSRSRLKESTGRSRMGLEIGYHVPKAAQNHDIVQLGRNADIVLPDDTLSPVHAVFELCPSSYRIFLRNRSSQVSSVMCEPISAQEVTAEEGHIRYSESYRLIIGSCAFELVWYITGWVQARRMAKEESLLEARLQLFLNQPLDQIEPKNIQKYPGSSLGFDVTGIPGESKLLGQDKSGQVRLVRILNPKGGEACAAVKGLASAVDTAGSRALIQNEAKMMRNLNHKHIIEIEILVCQDGNEVLQIIMPQRHSLTTLTGNCFKSGMIDSSVWKTICFRVAEHMLDALAYLFGMSIVHMDVKPDNILYHLEEQPNVPGGDHRGGFQFQLANFGQATYTHETNIAPTRCGTIDYYQAPEFHLGASKDVVRHSHKSDIYSLGVTILAALKGLQTFCSLKGTPNHQDIRDLVKSKIRPRPLLQDMGKLEPDERLSAESLLEKYFRKDRTEEATVEPIRQENVEAVRTCEVEMQDTEASRPSDPLSQEIPSMQCTIYSPARMRQTSERSSASRMPPPEKLTIVHQPLGGRVRKSGRATPNRTSRRTSQCPTPRIPQGFAMFQ